MKNSDPSFGFEFISLPEFEKEFRRLSKKYSTLNKDLETLKEVLFRFPTGYGKSFAVICTTQTVKIVKTRMACRALRGSSLRVIYAFLEQEQKLEFIEIYFKGEKENEDRRRINKYLRNHPD